MKSACTLLFLSITAIAGAGWSEETKFPELPFRPGVDATAGKVTFPRSPGPRNDIRVENRVPIPMRDGVSLYADIYRPVQDGNIPSSSRGLPTAPRRCRASNGGGDRKARILWSS